MINDNRSPLSPLGQAVFDMMNNMNNVTITSMRLDEETELRDQRRRAHVIDPIVRVSGKGECP